MTREEVVINTVIDYALVECSGRRKDIFHTSCNTGENGDRGGPFLFEFLVTFVQLWVCRASN